MWIVEQRDPSGRWFIRATVSKRQDAERYARRYKTNNPKLRFRYRRADDVGEPLDDSEPVEGLTGAPSAMTGRWMAEIRYRPGADCSDIIEAFDEFVELGRIIELGPDWHDIENITITLNRSARTPQKEFAEPVGSGLSAMAPRCPSGPRLPGCASIALQPSAPSIPECRAAPPARGRSGVRLTRPVGDVALAISAISSSSRSRAAAMALSDRSILVMHLSRRNAGAGLAIPRQ